MIPILEAVAKVENNLNGGQSRPWIVTTWNNKTYDEYVIKLFSEGAPLSGNYFNKEVIASILAQDFDIPTPEPALVHLSDSFIDTLNSTDRERVEKVRHRIVFGCKYYPGHTDYPPNLSPSFHRYVNTETIFAFDVLIRNFDRRKKKPNLMIDGNSYICIDHELSLDITRPFSEYDIWHEWTSLKKPESFHLFVEYLKRKKDEVDFLEFNEYFKTFNTKGLENLRCFLSNCQLDIDEFDTTIYYFEDIIRNKSRFNQLLKFLIS